METGKRSVMVDFMEGALGIVLKWPTLIPERMVIEVKLPNQGGTLFGATDSQEEVPIVTLVVDESETVPGVVDLIAFMIESKTPFATIHTANGYRRMLWSHGEYSVSAA